MKNAKMRDVEMRERSSRSLLANVLDLDDDFRGMNNSTMTSTMQNSAHHNNTSYGHGLNAHKVEDMYQHTTYSSVNGDLREVLKELKLMTEKMQRDEYFQDQCNDWKFAAMVIDRLCLWMFTIFTIVSTFAILFSAPNIFSWTPDCLLARLVHAGFAPVLGGTRRSTGLCSPDT